MYLKQSNKHNKAQKKEKRKKHNTKRISFMRENEETEDEPTYETTYADINGTLPKAKPTEDDCRHWNTSN